MSQQLSFGFTDTIIHIHISEVAIQLNVSVATIRNWIKEGLLDCKLSELRMNGRRIPSKQYNYNKGKE